MNTSFIDHLLYEEQIVHLEPLPETEQGELRVGCKRKLEQQNQPNKKAKHEDPQDPPPHDSMEEEDEDESAASVSFSYHSDESLDQDDDEVCESPLSQSLLDVPYFVKEEVTMKQELERISEALVVPTLADSPLEHVGLVIAEFNMKYHLQGCRMENMGACANEILIDRLLRKLELVKTYSDETSNYFKSESCFLVGLLSRNERARMFFLNTGALNYFLKLVKDPMCSLVTSRYCCYAIGNLITSLVDESAEAFHRYIMDEEILPLLFNNVKKNPKNWQYAQQVFFAVGNIAFIGDFERPLLDCGSVELAIDTLKRHNEYTNMCTDAIFFLKNMAYGEAGREEIISRGGINVALATLWKNPNYAELVELSFNLLFDLSFSGAIDEITRDPEPVKFLISLLKQHRSNLAPVKECSRTLCRIYSNTNADVRLMMIKEGLIETLFSILSEHSDNKVLRKQGETNFSRIVREKVPEYTELPTERVPSLLEFAARAVVDKNVSHTDASGSSVLPDDLVSFLAPTNHGSCVICSKTFLHHCVKAVCPTSLPDDANFPVPSEPVPLFLSFCSEECLQKVRSGEVELAMALTNTSASLLPNPSPCENRAHSHSHSSLDPLYLHDPNCSSRAHTHFHTSQDHKPPFNPNPSSPSSSFSSSVLLSNSDVLVGIKSKPQTTDELWDPWTNQDTKFEEEKGMVDFAFTFQS